MVTVLLLMKFFSLLYVFFTRQGSSTIPTFQVRLLQHLLEDLLLQMSSTVLQEDSTCMSSLMTWVGTAFIRRERCSSVSCSIYFYSEARSCWETYCRVRFGYKNYEHFTVIGNTFFFIFEGLVVLTAMYICEVWTL